MAMLIYQRVEIERERDRERERERLMYCNMIMTHDRLIIRHILRASPGTAAVRGQAPGAVIAGGFTCGWDIRSQLFAAFPRR